MSHEQPPLHVKFFFLCHNTENRLKIHNESTNQRININWSTVKFTCNINKHNQHHHHHVIMRLVIRFGYHNRIILNNSTIKCQIGIVKIRLERNVEMSKVVQLRSIIQLSKFIYDIIIYNNIYHYYDMSKWR